MEKTLEELVPDTDLSTLLPHERDAIDADAAKHEEVWSKHDNLGFTEFAVAMVTRGSVRLIHQARKQRSEEDAAAELELAARHDVVRRSED